jgi:hypothetical protein
LIDRFPFFVRVDPQTRWFDSSGSHLFLDASEVANRHD